MKTKFRTNVDCCKRFMDRVSQQFSDSQPLVGDRIDVYKTRDKVVELEVCGRRITTEFDKPVLEVELHLTRFWQEKGFTEFEKWVQGGGA